MFRSQKVCKWKNPFYLQWATPFMGYYYGFLHNFWDFNSAPSPSFISFNNSFTYFSNLTVPGPKPGIGGIETIGCSLHSPVAPRALGETQVQYAAIRAMTKGNKGVCGNLEKDRHMQTDVERTFQKRRHLSRGLKVQAAIQAKVIARVKAGLRWDEGSMLQASNSVI